MAESEALNWIMAHRDYPHENWCLMWPFFRDKHGRGVIHQAGEHYAHRLMCKLVKGEPPTPEHGTAHSCGAGHLGCVNPHHLSWKTQSENQLDCNEHGTQTKHRGGNRGRLTQEIADEIRNLKGIKTQWQIADEYRISESTVSDIWLNRTWTRPSKIVHWTEEEDAKIREAVNLGYNFRRMAQHVGRSVSAVMGRTYRLGLKSGQPPIGKHARHHHT